MLSTGGVVLPKISSGYGFGIFLAWEGCSQILRGRILYHKVSCLYYRVTVPRVRMYVPSEKIFLTFGDILDALTENILG